MRAISAVLILIGLILAFACMGCDGAPPPNYGDGGTGCAYINQPCSRTSDCHAIEDAIVECYRGRCVATINTPDLLPSPDMMPPPDMDRAGCGHPGERCCFGTICAGASCVEPGICP